MKYQFKTSTDFVDLNNFEVSDLYITNHYGRIVSFAEIWKDGSIVFGTIECECCGNIVYEGMLVSGKFFCFDCAKGLFENFC
jgi:hypothetical protein